MAGNLDFNVQLRLLNEQFNQGVNRAGNKFGELRQSIERNTAQMNTDTERAAQLIGDLSNASPDRLTAELGRVSSELRQMGAGANITREQLDTAMRAAAGQVVNLSEQLAAAKNEAERLGRTPATPAQLSEAANKVDNLTVSAEAARLKVEQLSRTNGTPEQIEQAKVKVDTLGASLDEARAKVTQMSQTRGTPEDIDSAKGKVDNLGSSLAEARLRVQQLSQTRGTPAEIEAAKAKIDNLSSAVDEARLNVERLSRTNGTPTDIIEAKAKIDSVSLSLDDAKLKVQQLSRTNGTPDQIVEAKGKVDSLAASVDEAKNSVRELSRTVGTPADIGEAKNRVNDLGLSLDEAKQKVRELSQTKGTPQDIEAAKAKIVSLKDELGAAKSVAKMLSETNASPQDIEAAQNKVKALTEYISGTRDEVKRLRETKGTPEDIASAKNEVNALKASVVEAKDQVKLLSQTRGTPEDIAEAKTKVAALSQSLTDAKNEAKLLSDTSASPQEIAAAKDKVEQLKGTLSATRDEVRQLSQTSASPAEIAEARAQLAALSQDLTGARTEARQLNQTSGSPAELIEAKAKVNELKDGLSAARDEVKRLRETNASPADIAAAKAAVAALKAELGEARGEARQLGQTSGSPADIAAATADVARLDTELNEARLAAERLNSTGASPADIAAAAERVNRLEQELGQASTASERLSNELAGAMNRASDTADNARNAIYRMANVRVPETIRGEIDQLNRSLTDFTNNSGRPAAEIERVTRATEEQIRRLENELRGLDDTQDRVNQGSQRFAGGINGVRSAMGSLQGMLAAAGLGIGVAEIIETADAFKTLEARIKLATGEGAAFVTGFEGVTKIANETFSSIESTGELFTRISQAGESLGLAQAEVLSVTRTINEAIQLSGGSAASADAAIVQLIQGLQSGVVRGEEFNSIMEQAPRLAKAMADGLGVTRGELRALAGEGKLTSEVVIDAVKSQGEAIAGEFASLPNTVSNALQVAKNQIFNFIGEIDKTANQSSKLADAITMIGDGLENLDPATVAVVEQAFSLMIETIGTVLTTVRDAYNSFSELNAIISGTVDEGERIGLITSLLQRVNVAVGVIADGFKGLSIIADSVFGSVAGIVGSALVGIAKLSGGTSDIGESLIAMQEKLHARSEKNMMDFESSSKKAWAEITKTAQDRLNETAQEATDAYDSMKADATKSAEAQEGAFTKMANAHIAAYGESALAALQVEGAERGLKVAIDDTGKAIIEKMSAEDQASSEAEKNAKALDKTYRELADTLGVGITKGYADAKASVLELSGSFDVLTDSGYQAGDVLAAALVKMTTQAKNTTELSDIILMWEDLGEQGQLTGEDLAAGLDLANERLDALTDGVNSVNEAYKVLGLTTRAEAAKQAEAYTQAYGIIVKDGEATSGQLIDGFKKYAKAAVAANGDVVSSQVKTEAAQRGLTVAVDETGRVTFKSMAEAAEATNRVRPAIDNVTSGYSSLSGSANSAGNTMVQAARNAESAYDQLQRKIKEVKEAQAVESADETMKNLRIYGTEKAPVQGNQFGTRLGVENFLQSQGLSQSQAIEEARKLYAKQGVTGGALNFGDLQGYQDGQVLTGQDLSQFKTASMYLAEIAEKARQSDRSRSNNEVATTASARLTTQEYSRFDSAPSVTKTIDVNLKLGGATAPMSIKENQENALMSLLKQLQDSKAIAGY